MGAEHLLLGLLRDPATPFDLKAALEERAGHLASAELADVGSALAALEERGWIRVERGDAPGPHADLARRTPEGEHALMEWLARGAGVRPADGDDPLRAHLLSELGDGGSVRMMLATWRERLSLWVRRLLVEERRLVAEAADFPDGLDDGRLQAYLSLRLELATTRARLAWCDEALEIWGRREDWSVPGREGLG